MRFSYYYQVYLHFIPGSRGSHPDLGPSRDRHRPDAHRRRGLHLRSDRPDCQGLRHGLLGLPDRLCDPDADHRNLQDFQGRQVNFRTVWYLPPAAGDTLISVPLDFQDRQAYFRNVPCFPPKAGDTLISAALEFQDRQAYFVHTLSLLSGGSAVHLSARHFSCSDA